MRAFSELYWNNAVFAILYILVVAMILSAVVDLIVTRFLRRLAERTRTRLDDVVLAELRRPLAASVLFIGAWFALQRLGYAGTLDYVGKGVLLTVAVLLWTRAGMRVSATLLEALAENVDRYHFIQPRTMPLFEIVIKSTLIAGAVYGVMLAWRVDLTAWLASAGILGIAIGFAAKDTLANFFSGIFIVADAPYKIGDFVQLSSGERGKVTDIGIRSTRILTRDDIEITIPNAAIANAKIVNEAGGPHEMERVRLTVGVAYGSDIDLVREVLLEVAHSSRYLVDEPAPRVRFREFQESSLKFQLLGWIEEPVLRGRALDELHCAVYKQFAAHGIRIPFPQRDVHMKGEGS